MIIDNTLEFADAASVADIAGTHNVGDIIDSSVVRDLGNGQPVYLVITVDTEIITAGTAGTIQFQLVSDSTDTIATDGSQSIHVISEEYVTDDAAANDAELSVGQVPFLVALPVQGQQYEHYLAVQYVVGTETTSAGAISAFLTLDPYGWKAYPDASN